MKNNTAGKNKWFFLIFIFVGLIVTFFSFFKPCVNVLMARKWIQQECKIIKSEVKTTIKHGHNGNSSSTKIDILYEYMCRGQKFESTRYSFFDKLNRTRNGAEKIAGQFPVGSTKVCYVNPNKPIEAVLERNFDPWNLLGLVPLVFTFVGVMGIRRSRAWQKSIVLKETPGEIELKPVSRMGKAIGFLVGGLFFCGGAIFIWKHESLGVSLWSLPSLFVSIGCGGGGLLLLFVSVTCFMELYNPVVKVKLMPARVEIGKAAAITWEVEGQVERLAELKISLECRKEEKIKNGNNPRSVSTRDTKLYSDELYSTCDLNQIAKGEIGFMLESNQSATYCGDVTSIHWYIMVKGKIKRWPDIDDEFKFEVINT